MKGKKRLAILLLLCILTDCFGIVCHAEDLAAMGQKAADFGVYATYKEGRKDYFTAETKNGKSELQIRGGTSITAKGIPENIRSLVVYPIVSEDTAAWAWFSACMNGKGTDLAPYEIYFLDQKGEKTSAENVTITISIPGNMGNPAVFSLSSGGDLNMLSAQKGSGKMTFRADGREYYILAEKINPTPTVTPTPSAKPSPPENMVNYGTGFSPLKLRSSRQTRTTITLNWSRVSEADGYIIYGNHCNRKGKTYGYAKLKTITGNRTLSWTQTGRAVGNSYKYRIKAYKLVNGKKKIIAVSARIHACTKGGKYGTAKRVSVSRTGRWKEIESLSLKKGKTVRIRAKEITADKKPVYSHRKIGYESSNKKIATVTADGVIKGKGKGTCTIWVYAQDGIYKKIKVTVK